MSIQTLTVRQLIEQLQAYPQDLPVVVQSYEDGYDPVTALNELMIAPTPNREWYIGVYEKADGTGQQVLLISSRYNRAELDTPTDDGASSDE
ncbi:MAG: hypothetical protein ACOYL5_19990 [Phototrophicaceae bacterium]